MVDGRRGARCSTTGQLRQILRAPDARSLFAPLAPRYDAMAEILSFGQNRRWRRFLVSRVNVSRSGKALDVATGTARVAIDLHERTGAEVVGLDLSEPMLRAGAAAVLRAGHHGAIRLLLGRAEQLPFGDDTFDAVTFTYLLRYVGDPAGTLAELARVLRPGGTLACLEFHVPTGFLWRALWVAYTRVFLPPAGRVVSRGWHEVGRFLGPSIVDFYVRFPLERQLDLWRAAGVNDVRTRSMSLGGGIVVWGTKSRARPGAAQ